jgi:catechol 2,3-dioxygenase-like lactoylglutathione lyase family enzyme
VRHGRTNPEIARLQGVRRISSLFRKEATMNDTLTLGKISQIARTVRDIEEARKWYGEVLGLSHLYSFGNLAFFDCGGIRLFLSEAQAAAGPESIIYFNVADIRTAHAGLVERGVEFLGAPHLIHRHQDGTEEWMAAFNDNEGRPLAILSQVPKS